MKSTEDVQKLSLDREMGEDRVGLPGFIDEPNWCREEAHLPQTRPHQMSHMRVVSPQTSGDRSLELDGLVTGDEQRGKYAAVVGWTIADGPGAKHAFPAASGQTGSLLSSCRWSPARAAERACQAEMKSTNRILP